jgi:hypothetical protein
VFSCAGIVDIPAITATTQNPTIGRIVDALFFIS